MNRPALLRHRNTAHLLLQTDPEQLSASELDLAMALLRFRDVDVCFDCHIVQVREWRKRGRPRQFSPTTRWSDLSEFLHHVEMTIVGTEVNNAVGSEGRPIQFTVRSQAPGTDAIGTDLAKTIGIAAAKLLAFRMSQDPLWPSPKTDGATAPEGEPH